MASSSSWKGGSGGWEARMASRAALRPAPSQVPLQSQSQPQPPSAPAPPSNESVVRSSIVRLCDEAILSGGDLLVALVSASVMTKALISADSLEVVAAETILDCAAAMPFKSALYGAFTGLINTAEFSTVILRSLSARLADAIRYGDAESSKGLLRFTATIARCGVASLASVEKVFDSVASALSSAPQPIADSIAAALVLSLPWAAGIVSSTASSAVDSFVGGHSKAPPIGLCVWPSRATHAPLARAWGVLRECCALPPYAFVVNPENTSSVPAAELEFPDVEFPVDSATEGHHCSGPQQWTPPVFSGDAVPSFDRVVLGDVVGSISIGFRTTPAEAAKFLVALPGAQRADVFDAALSRLFVLPEPKERPEAIAAIVLALSRAGKDYVDQFVVCFKALFDGIPEMDVECADRFAQWLAGHIANFDFNFNWAYL